MPSLSRWPPLVRAVTTSMSAVSPLSTTNFSPSITQPAPFFLAVVETSLQIVARVLLELREGKGLAAVDDAGDVRGLLFGRAAMAQEAAAEHHGGQIRLQHQRLAQRFHHDHGFDAAGAEAAIVFGERQAEQALLGELAPDALAPAALLRHVFLALRRNRRRRSSSPSTLSLRSRCSSDRSKSMLCSSHISRLCRAQSLSSCPRLSRASTSSTSSRAAGRGCAADLSPAIARRRCVRRRVTPIYSPSTALVMMLRWISLEPP